MVTMFVGCQCCSLGALGITSARMIMCFRGLSCVHLVERACLEQHVAVASAAAVPADQVLRVYEVCTCTASPFTFMQCSCCRQATAPPPCSTAHPPNGLGDHAMRGMSVAHMCLSLTSETPPQELWQHMLPRHRCCCKHVWSHLPATKMPSGLAS